jgi:hypothetical protein
MIGLFNLFFNSGEIFHFFNQGADIKFISSLVNKKARFDHLNALKKFEIAKPGLSWGIVVPKHVI